MMIEVGDEIQVGQVVARVQSIDEMLIKIPFLTQDAQTLNEGQEATFTLTQSFEQLIGKVDQIGAIEQTDASGRRFTLVTFVVTNPGGLTNTHQATVKVAGLAGMDQGTFYNKEEAVIVAKTSGEVKTVAYKVGDKVNKDNMMPPPKVESAVIRLKRNQVQSLGCDEKLFVNIVKTAFNQRRKTLRNALKSFRFSPDAALEQLLTQRAERLSVEEFVFITNQVVEAD